jgi:hypothetical protein
MARKIIGLTGRMGSGMSVAAMELQRLGFTRTRFAGPLKQMMRCLGLTDEHIEGKLKEVPCDILGGKTPRFAMQTIGTEWGRDMISSKLWVDVWKHHIEHMPEYIPISVEDVRFANEANAVRSVGGIVVQINRPGRDDNIIHASELFDFKTDMLIENDGSIEALQEKIRRLAKSLADTTPHSNLKRAA